jgi:hypothetical protein
LCRLQYSIERISVAIGCLSTSRCVLYSTFPAKYRAQNPVWAMSTLVPSNPVKWHFLLFSLQYSIDRISAAIVGVSTNRCALYLTYAAKCSLFPPDYATSTLVPVKFNKVTVLLVQASIFNSTYIRCDWLFIEKSMRVVLHICCHIKRVSSCFRYVNNGPGQIKYIYISCYSGINIQLNVSPMILVKCRQLNARYTQICCHIRGTISALRYANSCPGQIQYRIFS